LVAPDGALGFILIQFLQTGHAYGVVGLASQKSQFNCPPRDMMVTTHSAPAQRSDSMTKINLAVDNYRCFLSMNKLYCVIANIQRAACSLLHGVGIVDPAMRQSSFEAMQFETSGRIPLARLFDFISV
jgi:hypothetical protein